MSHKQPTKPEGTPETQPEQPEAHNDAGEPQTVVTDNTEADPASNEVSVKEEHITLGDGTIVTNRF